MFRAATIRTRLLVGFVLIALLPTIATTVASMLVIYLNGQQQVIDRLESVATLRAVELGSLVQSVQEELLIALYQEYALERARAVLDPSPEQVYSGLHDAAMRNSLMTLVAQMQYTEEIFFLDLDGRVALSTELSREGRVLSGRPYFVHGLEGPYVKLPFISTIQNELAIFAAIPVVGEEDKTLGVLVGRAGVDQLVSILQDRTGLDETGTAYLVNSDHALLSPLRPFGIGRPDEDLGYAYSEGINTAIGAQASNSGVYNDYSGERVIGVYRWLPDLHAVLVVEQEASEVYGVIYTTVLVNAGVALAAVLLAVGASLLITRSIASPLVDLADTAMRIAGGDLDRAASIDREDEIGTLAQAFNSMTTQLRELIANLEHRVEMRTQALQQRALQLETSALVSREISAILEEIDVLLLRVTDLIQRAFGYYSVRVFLVDSEAGVLIQRASSGEVGTPERLDIKGDSLNSRVVRANEHAVVDDLTLVESDVSGDGPQLARSELVIPLRVGRQVIGTLDVLSTTVGAFSPDDVLAIQSLGDQIAIAIENARLYGRSRELAVVQERNRLARELHDSVTQSLYSLGLLAEGWRRLIGAGKLENVEDHLARIGEIAQSALKEMRRLIYELRPPMLEQEGLLGALHRRVEAVEDRVGIEAQIVAEDLIDMPPQVEEGLYRIALEALNNSLKHASAGLVTVHIRIDDDLAVLEVSDDGVGFDCAQVAPGVGMGIASMQERAAQIGGELSISSAPGSGTTVRVAVDCREWNCPRLVGDELTEAI